MTGSISQQPKKQPLSFMGRIAHALVGRHWSMVAIELLLIVVGILVALSIDDWVQEREDRRTERVYLGLLVRDLDQMIDSMQGYIETETLMAEASATVLRMLADQESEIDPIEVRGHLADMGTRRTLRLVSAAYTDLTSTGNLQLIHARNLRDQLLGFFANVSRTQLVIEKNNNVFIDDMYWSFIIDAGITWVPTNWENLGQALVQAEVIFNQFLGSDLSYPDDAILMQPRDAEIWSEVRRMCFLRLRVSSVGLGLVNMLMEQANTLKASIEAELDNQG